MSPPTEHACPCGSGRSYETCCGPLHDGSPAETAEALMRSRYAAYATNRLDYVFRTWHPRTRPDDVEENPEITWLGLDVVAADGGGPDDEQGTVEFHVYYVTPSGPAELQELSSFERRRGRWVYVDGVTPDQGRPDSA